MIDTIAKCFHEWVIWHYTSSIIGTIVPAIEICVFLVIIYNLARKAQDKF